VSAPLLSAFVISLAPMLLQLLPRSGGFGELLGKFVAPFSLAGIAFSLLAAVVVNETGNYRTIWLFPAAAGILQAIVMCWLWIPEGQARVSHKGLGNKFIDSVYDQMTKGDRRLFGGVVTTEDADGASLFESARNLLGNPYELINKLGESHSLPALISGLKDSHDPTDAEGGPASTEPTEVPQASEELDAGSTDAGSTDSGEP